MTLTIDKKYKIEKACERLSRKNAMKRAISLVLITDTVAVATDGRILAVVPINRNQPCENLLVSGETTAQARQWHTVETAFSEEGEDSPSPDNFPNWEKVLDAAELVPNRRKVTFSLKLLAALANAIGATDQITFAIDCDSETSAREITEVILVTSRDSEGRGLLMPMACI